MVRKEGIMEAMKAVMKESMVIMNMTIMNMTITIMITVTNSTKSGESMVATRENTMVTKKVVIMENMNMDTNMGMNMGITMVVIMVAILEEVATKVLYHKKLKLLKVKKRNLIRTLINLQKNGGWLVITGVDGDMIIGDHPMLITKVVAGNTTIMACMDTTVEGVAIEVMFLTVANRLIQKLLRDVVAVMEVTIMLVIMVVTISTIMVRDLMNMIITFKVLGHSVMIVSVMIGEIGIIIIIILNTCSIWSMNPGITEEDMVDAVEDMDEIVFHMLQQRTMVDLQAI